MAAAFDPDAYLAKKTPASATPAFDPDAYLRQRAAPASEGVPGMRAAPSFGAQVRQEVTDVLAGAVRGAGSIGATILRPFETAEENQARRQGTTQGLQSLVGADPTSLAFQGGQLAGEVAGTLPVGRILAVPVQAAARAVPRLAPLAQALSTGGFAPTQAATRAGGAAARVGAGATVGAGSAALVNPEDAEFGAAVGAGLPVVVGAVTGVARIPLNRAARLARNALGDDLSQAVNALRNAQPGVGVAEATADIRNPAWQALVNSALKSTPESQQFLTRFNQLTDDEARNVLATLAGGDTATATRRAAELAKQQLNDLTSPARQAALTRAGQTARVVGFEQEAAEQAAAATQRVEDVRRLTAAGEKATTASMRATPVPGQPRVPPRYTYPGELAVKAEEWASQAATGSLDLGQGARFAQSAADSLRKAGIKPEALQTQALVGNLQSLTRNPEFAGNDVMEKAIANVARDVAEWTGKGGIIDPVALDAIRKNSVNAAVRDLLKGADPTTQKKAAAEVMSIIKPRIIDAIENAGGAGYREYLEEYAKGMQKIAQQKLKGEALRLWKNDKDGFVRLVDGESPEVVEKFLGRGNYDLARDLVDNEVAILQNQARRHVARMTAAKDATEGTKALATIIDQTISSLRVPNRLQFWATATNATLKELQEAVGARTTQTLAKAMQSPEAAANLLESLPAAERSRIVRFLENPSLITKAVAQAARVAPASQTNSLAPQDQPQNALAR
jgi:hypothetical protein